MGTFLLSNAYSCVFFDFYRFVDVLDFMADVGVFNVTDLDTLGCLLQRAHSPSDYLTSVFPCIRRLDITLRFPLPIFETLETPEAISSVGSPPANASTAWLRLLPAIAQLKKLQTLHIWLDHEDPSSWSVVNERAILSPLTQLTRIPNFSITLPKLHPGLESADRHFGEDSPAPPFKIQRRLRQSYHSNETCKGNFCVRREADFPLLLGCPGFEDTPLAELEVIERSWWKGGFDVKKFLDEYDGWNVCYDGRV